ncbi:hypothetical protein HELRODRAFT_172476 [Helobdella robusta]|uniref:Uncharacterized protein n=1 Tax=Helobdella robusta TaxID=6412 RepID=T1F5D4_HELRO|nr:hypothetical protein HELRODRAFT_172476 [Helobdella robusta]ESO04801.1 hypothetical protein HELRODRAFT_172476 [Helobdella robusta]
MSVSWAACGVCIRRGVGLSAVRHVLSIQAVSNQGLELLVDWDILFGRNFVYCKLVRGTHFVTFRGLGDLVGIKKRKTSSSFNSTKLTNVLFAFAFIPQRKISTPLMTVISIL